MVYIQSQKRLALLVALGMLLVPLRPLPIPAQETPATTIQEAIDRSDEADTGREGLASYYAKRFNGRRTHSGARYNPEKLTAASPDLPMGCKVRVKNLVNGKETVVTVNDRCRKRRFPFIDLSRAAARKLGFLGRGTARVMITRLEDDESS